MIDPSEKFVYINRRGASRPWWTEGIPVPVDHPRDYRWYLRAYDFDAAMTITVDLRTLKLYAKFTQLIGDVEERMDRNRPIAG